VIMLRKLVLEVKEEEREEEEEVMVVVGRLG
jgi:hypothetical protein